MALFEVNGLTKTYITGRGAHKVEALKGIDLAVEEGEFVAIMGESGSGDNAIMMIVQ